MFLKRVSAVSGVVRHPNVEAEILAPLLLRAAGLKALIATPRSDPSGSTLFVETPLVRRGAAPFSLAPTAAEWRPGLAHIELGTLAELAIVDILIGNADRSLSNLLLVSDKGRVVPVPIDHNAAFLIPGRDTRTLALGAFVPGFEGAQASDAVSAYRRWQLRRCGTIQHILESTPVFERLDPSLPAGRHALGQASPRVLGRLTERVVERALDRAATTLGLHERSVRLSEIGRVLQKRRAGLPSAVKRVLSG